MSRIYLDNAATTPLRREVVDAMDEARADAYNPSSIHAEGRRARARLDDARDRVAACLGVSRKEIAFTGSGTESDNAAILGAVRASGRKGHVLASAIDHHAVLHSLDALAAEGHEVELLPVDDRGAVDPAAFAAALRPATILASVFYANNEIGTVSPVAELARIARERGVLFHTDAVQAPGWLPLDAASLGADLLSISAHKFEGPKGVGALYIRSGVLLEPIVHGGGQEFGRRSGTENVIGVVGLARALELAVGEPDGARGARRAPARPPRVGDSQHHRGCSVQRFRRGAAARQQQRQLRGRGFRRTAAAAGSARRRGLGGQRVYVGGNRA